MLFIYILSFQLEFQEYDMPKSSTQFGKTPKDLKFLNSFKTQIFKELNYTGSPKKHYSKSMLFSFFLEKEPFLKIN